MKAVVLLLLCLATTAYAQVFARAILQPVDNSGVRGFVQFSQVPGTTNVTVMAYVTNITYGTDIDHGIHVHWWGDMSGVNSGAQSVGGHWNPTGAPHSCPPNPVRHFGDMGNWTAVAGTINQTKVLDLLELFGNNSIIGRAVIFHNATDDCVTMNTGNAGGRMATGVIGVINSTALAGSGDANTSIAVTVAGCMLQPASGSSVSGMVYLTQSSGTGSTTVLATVNGITGNHGFHLHWWGDISNPNGTATGAHFNPYNHVHGIPPVSDRHLGDMGIISFYDANGTAYYNYTNDLISLNGMNNVIGRAIHVHLNSDDCSNPVGNGGARVAQCVIGILNATAFVEPTFPAGVPTTQNGTSICATITSSSSMSSSSGMSSTSMSSSSMSSSSSSMSSSSTASEPSDASTIAFSVACIVLACIAMLF